MNFLLIDDFLPMTFSHLSLLDRWLSQVGKKDTIYLAIVPSKRWSLSARSVEATLKDNLKKYKATFIVAPRMSSIQNLLSAKEAVISGAQDILSEFGLPNYGSQALEAEKKAVLEGREGKAPLWSLSFLGDNAVGYCHDVSLILGNARYRHSVSVAKTAARIAEANAADPYRAFQAGMLHDVGKDIDKALQRNLVRLHYPECQNYPGFALHQFVGAFYAKNHFHVQDEEILRAIARHCTGCGDMGVLDKIIYTADKCEPTRAFQTSHILKDALEELDKGFHDTLVDQMAYFQRHEIDYRTNPSSADLYERYTKEETENAYRKD